MSCPPQVISSLESILDLYFSDVHDKYRATFILTDNLLETSCKKKARQEDHTFGLKKNFHNTVTSDVLGVPTDLCNRLEDFHDTRNKIQHQGSALTVNQRYCADAIICSVTLLEELWPSVRSENIRNWMSCALKVVWLYSSHGDISKREPFEIEMRRTEWRGESDSIQPDEVAVKPGNKNFWHWALHHRTPQVEKCLAEIDVDQLR